MHGDAPATRRRLRAVHKAALLLFLLPAWCGAEQFPLPGGGDALIGSPGYTTAFRSDTLVDIAREFDLGYDEILYANPGINRWIPGQGTIVQLPTFYVLPEGKRQGIVLNLAELRLYYFPPKGRAVVTFPVSIGRMDWRTPLGTTRIVRKERDPDWYPPASVREEHLAEGEYLPRMIPGGFPENPLGRYALRLGVPGYLIHGTGERKALGIGMHVTHGCIRMYPEDIETLYSATAVGTAVRIIDAPVKLGWRGDELFLELHRFFDPDDLSERISPEEVWEFVRTRAPRGAEIDLDALDSAIARGDGVPTRIGFMSPAAEDR